jgi:hypothetical protein
MAIVQISRITNRRGLQQDLPQLAPGELGWCLDTRLLFIGNGTLEEGSPAIGNTEVLTEFSDIKRLVENLSGPFVFNIATTRTLADGAGTYIDAVEGEIGGFIDTGFALPNRAKTVRMEYQILRDNKYRFGTMDISLTAGDIQYRDDFIEPNDLGVVLAAVNSGGANKIFYSTTGTGNTAVFKASVRYFQ